MKRLFFLITTLLMLTGCLSHWFVESEVRLQVENKTPYTIVGVSVVSLDSTMQKNWIKDTIPPGERSSVVAGDWIGTFNLGVSYIKEGENAVFVQIFEAEELNGGSVFAQISEKDGFWSFDQK
jgi:hypothetical protein